MDIIEAPPPKMNPAIRQIITATKSIQVACVYSDIARRCEVVSIPDCVICEIMEQMSRVLIWGNYIAFCD
jgi:hypothetical protein